MSNSNPDQGPKFLEVFRLALVIFALCMAVFLTGLDQTILATAAPTISNEFHALNDIGWWTAVYLLTLSTFQLVYGKLYSMFSIKLVYLFAIGVFELGSLICTAAPNSTALICGRAIAGLGAAGIFSGSILVLTQIIPLERRAAYTGLLSGMFGVAAVIGPFLGGVLAEKSTWRWCFGINLPLGFLAICVCAFLLKIPRNLENRSLKDKVKEFDLPGTVTLITSLICLLLALQWGGSTYPWNNGRIIALLTLSAILFATFCAIQIFGHGIKTIPATIVQRRSVWFAAIYGLCISGGVYVAVLYLPIWFQAVRNVSALQSGIRLTPLIVGYVVFSILGGLTTTAIGYYNPVMIAGSILTSIGAGFLTTLGPNTNSSAWIGYQALYGFGVGFGIQQSSFVVQTLLPEQDVPVGVTLMTLVQNLSASIFVAVGQSIFQNSLNANIHGIVADVNTSSLLQSGATDITSMFPPAQRAQILSAYSTALVHTLYISLGLSCASILGALGVRWQSMKNKASGVSEKASGG